LASAPRPAALRSSKLLYQHATRQRHGVSCVFLAPALGLSSAAGAVRSFGIVLILTVGHAISLAAHYELFNIGKRSHAYFPLQERVTVGATLAAVAAYLLALAL
jgi:hypothetical protein